MDEPSANHIPEEKDILDDISLVDQRGLETEKSSNLKELETSENRYYQLFNEAPFSLWEQDFSHVRKFMLELKSKGVQDFHTYFQSHPDEIKKCIRLIQIISVNQAAMSVYKAADRADLLMNYETTFVPDSYPAMVDLFVALISGTQKYQTEMKRKTLTGQPIIVQFQAIVATGCENLSKVLLTSFDVTAQKQTEGLLTEAHKSYKMLIEALTAIVIGIDASDNVLYWNPAAEKTLGLLSSDVIGMSLSEAPIPWTTDKLKDCINQCRTAVNVIAINDFTYTRKDGSKGFLDLTLTPLNLNVGRNAGILIQGVEITARKMIEVELIQAKKMESLGQLAAGIAHEINTPAQFIANNLFFIKQSFDEWVNFLHFMLGLLQGDHTHDTLKDQFEYIKRNTDPGNMKFILDEIPLAMKESMDGLDRISHIVKAMREYAYPGFTEKTLADINHAIENTVTISRNAWKHVAEIVLDLDPDMPLVPCVVSEFNQVILNLILNSTQAIEDVAATKQSEIWKGKISVITRGSPESVEVRVKDNGAGIPEQYRDRIFDPFFTTKEVGRGTGQGLMIAHQIIVEKHDGSIRFETEEGHGTTFIVTLPLS